MWEICLKLTTNIPEWLHCHCFSVLIINFEQILHKSDVSIVDLEDVDVDCIQPHYDKYFHPRQILQSL